MYDANGSDGMTNIPLYSEVRHDVRTCILFFNRISQKVNKVKDLLKYISSKIHICAVLFSVLVSQLHISNYQCLVIHIIYLTLITGGKSIL